MTAVGERRVHLRTYGVLVCVCIRGKKTSRNRTTIDRRTGRETEQQVTGQRVQLLSTQRRRFQKRPNEAKTTNSTKKSTGKGNVLSRP